MLQLLDRPRLLGLFCAAGAVGLGIFYMAAAGAPSHYLFINLAALVLGASFWLSLRSRAGAPFKDDGRIMLALGLTLLATALFGAAVEGASRWVFVGPISLQISLVVLPAMILLHARSADPIGTLGVAIAALALALQPDRAMAGVLAAGLGASLLARRDRLGGIAFAASMLAFGATMLRPDALPAVPYVDRILYTAFDVSAAAGLAVIAGSLILVVPGLAGARAVPAIARSCWRSPPAGRRWWRQPRWAIIRHLWSAMAGARYWATCSAQPCCRARSRGKRERSQPGSIRKAGATPIPAIASVASPVRPGKR